MEPNYDTLGSKSAPRRMVSDVSDHIDTSSISSAAMEVNVFHATVRTIDSPFGKLRVPSDLENDEVVFLILATLSILGTTGMTIYRLVNVIDESDSTFAIVLLVNIVFCLVYVFHGVFGERPYELWAFMAATLLVTLYCIIEFAVTSDRRTTVKVVRLIVVVVFAPILIYLSFVISKRHYTSKNLVIRTIRSANVQFQNMCTNLFIFETLLKFDLQTGVSLVILVLDSGVTEATIGEIIILVVGSFLEIAWLFAGTAVAKYEDVMWVYVFLVFSVPHPIYTMYKIIKTGVDWNEQDKATSSAIIACACLFMVTRCVVCYFLWVVVRNFGKGLRQAIYQLEAENDKEPHLEVDANLPSEDNAADDYLGENVNYDIH